MIKAQQNLVPKNILDPIFVDENQPNSSNTEVESYHDPQDIVFSHKFITIEIQKFGLDTEGCINCSQLVKHFVDPRSLYDALSENKIEWVKLSHAVMSCPYPNLHTPVYDPSNINTVPNPT